MLQESYKVLTIVLKEFRSSYGFTEGLPFGVQEQQCVYLLSRAKQDKS